MKKIFTKMFATLLVILLCLSVKTNAQIAIDWASCYGGTSKDGAESIYQTTDGGYIIAGYAESNDGDVSGNHGDADFWVVKIDEIGNVEWQKCLGGSDDDYAKSIQQTTDGGYIVAGYTESNDGDVSGNHGGADYWVVKIDEFGNIEWQKCFGGSRDDHAQSIQQTIDGGYIVEGHTNSYNGDVSGNHGLADYWLVKINEIGNVEWQKCLGGSNYDEAKSIQQTIDGGYIVAGYTYSHDGDVSGHHEKQDYWVVKIDELGNIEWQKCFGGSEGDRAYSIQQTIDGGYIVAGFTYSIDGDVSGNNGYSDTWVIKIDELGSVEWKKCFGGNLYDDPQSIQQTTDGGYIVLGSTWSIDGDVSGNQGFYDYWVFKINEIGNLEWQKCLGGSNYDLAMSIQQTIDGRYIIAGSTSSNDGDVSGNHEIFKYDYWVVKSCVPDVLSIEVSSPNYCYTSDLVATDGFDAYLWNTGDTTQSITIDTGGLYHVTAVNENGCPSEAEINAPDPLEPYNQSEICMVTLDEETGKNMIVYKPIVTVGIDSIFFYRLNNQTSEYEWIGSNSINNTGLFVDTVAIPAQQNYQYKIAIIDTCGKTSELSQMHRTIFLQGNTGGNDEINIFWNAYEGFEYLNFGIYRSVNGGDFFLIANVPNNTYSYTDLYPPTGDKKYQIRVVKDPPCNPDKGNFSFATSNTIIIKTTSINENKLGDFNIYPNPFDNKLIINRDQNIKKDVKLELIDIYGRLLDTFIIKSGEKNMTISTNHLQSGVYYLRFNNIIEKLIIKK